MSRNNKVLVPQAIKALEKFKYEVASEIGLPDYSQIDKGNLTSKENGAVGGEMVKRMIEAYEKDLV